MDIVIGFALGIPITVMLFLMSKFGMPLFFAYLGDKDTWYSPVRVKPPEGQYAVLKKWSRNGKSGGFAGIIHSIRGHIVNTEYDFVKGEREPSWFDTHWGGEAGVEWTGFFKQYHIVPSEYAAIDKPADSTDFKIVSKQRNKDAGDPYYFYQYSAMAAQTKEAEISGNAQVDLDALFTTRHRNPYKIHFLTGKWTVRATKGVETASREYVRHKTFDQLREEHGRGSDSYANYVEKQDRLTQQYGLEIADVDLVTIQLVGSQAMRDAAQKKEVERNLADAQEETNRRVISEAEGKKQAAIVTAEGRRESRKIEAEGIKDEFAARMSVEEGAELSWAEAVREGSFPGTVVFGTSGVSIPTGSKK